MLNTCLVAQLFPGSSYDFVSACNDFLVLQGRLTQLFIEGTNYKITQLRSSNESKAVFKTTLTLTSMYEAVLKDLRNTVLVL